MPKLHIRLFGQCCISEEGTEPLDIEQGKVLELLSYLLIFRERPHLREALADLLWGHMQSTANTKKYLRQTVWQLQQVLGRLSAPDQPVLLAGADWLSINPDCALWLDVAVLEEATSRTRSVPGSELSAEQAHALSAAADIYSGDLLEGCYQDWCLFERERLQSLYLGALDKLMGHCEAQWNPELGIDYGTRILRFDRAREHTHRRLMRFYALAGDRTSALRQYHRCVAALDETLGVGPAAMTIALYEQVRDNTAAIISHDTRRLPALLTQLREIDLRLSHTRSHLRDQIEALERTLGESRP